MTEEEDPLVLFLCVGLTVGALIVILLICWWCHSRKKGAVPSSRSAEVTASERVHSTTRNQSDLVTPSTEQYALDNRCQTAMETLLTRDETHDISRHNVPPNLHQNRLSRGTLGLADRPTLSVEVTVHSTTRNQPDLVTPPTGQYIPDNRWQNAMETLLMRDGPYGSSPHNRSPNTNQSRLSGGSRRYQNNAMRQNSIDPPSYESLQNIPANNNDATGCSSEDLHLDSGISHQPATSSAEAGNQNTVYQPADYEPPPPEYGTVVHYKDIYSVADE